MQSWRSGLALVLALGVCGVARAVPSAFTEEALTRGIDYTPSSAGPQTYGRGVAFADLDGDGDPDVVTLGASSSVVGIYENDGTGHFSARSATSGIPALTLASAVVAFDYDRDGDLDLYLTRFGAANALLRNDGGFSFSSVGSAEGVADAGQGTGPSVADYDGDGWLDLHVPNYGSEDRLYHNLGAGLGFEEVAGTHGVADVWNGFQSVLVDFDHDGDADLYVSNDKRITTSTDHNRLYENVNGLFTDISSGSGADVSLMSMGVGVGDFDGNGFQDLYCTNIWFPSLPFPNYLMLNQTGLGFVEDADGAGVESHRFAWCAIFFDYDNDGNLDLYVCNQDAADRLYANDGSFPATDVAPSVQIADTGRSFGGAVADVDADGDLDLLLQQNDARIKLYINHEGEKRSWAAFDVVGEGPARYAPGALVEVVVSGVSRWRAEVAGGNSYKSHNDRVLHFGLDGASQMDSVNVLWPGGTTRSLTGLPTGERWTLYPPDRLGDADGDGDRDLDDLQALLGCSDGADPRAVAPGCEMLDYDGNSQLEGPDYAAFAQDYDAGISDCNANGSPDVEDILLWPPRDANRDGVLDSCLPQVPALAPAPGAGLAALLALSGFLALRAGLGRR